MTHATRRGAIAGAALLLGLAGIYGAPTATASSAHKTVKTVEVNSKYTFKAKTLTIKAGTKVTWVNASDAPHTVTHISKNWSVNKQLPESGQRSFTFTTPGTYTYKCTIHPYMKGKIIVTM